MKTALGDRDFDRRIPLDGCFNFRDLGGYGTTDGLVVRAGSLFRADGPRSLTEPDAETLGSLSLATIIDLRTRNESDEHGRYSECATSALEVHLPMTDTLPDSDALMLWSDPMVVAAHYWELLTDGHEAICETLAILTDPAAYPVLMHCSAGKDRTGVLSAIVLGLLGVPDDVIVDDYAFSGPAMVGLVEALQESYPDFREELVRLAPAMTAADPIVMQWFVANLRAEYGSFEGYIEAIGMESAIPYVRRHLVTE